MASKPTQRSLAHLRKDGWLCHIVEHWNQFARIRQDCYGFGDILAVQPDRKQIALVQTTSTANFSKRMEKILAEPKAAIWRTAGGLIIVHGWAKRGARGQRKVWTLKEIILY
jgi:hypothetical protein